MRYQFVLSLPERLVRSLCAVSGGLLREIGEVALPARLRRTTLYRVMVDVTLRFLIEQMGQVRGIYPTEEGLAKNFLLKRGASHGIEWLGILTIHVSPVWVLAALADVSGAGHELIQQIAEALKAEGLVDPQAHFQTMDDLLDGLENTSAQLARTLNMPPVDVAGLRSEWKKIKEALPSVPHAQLPSPERLKNVWVRLMQSAESQNRSVFTVCSGIAVSALTEVPANLLWLSRAIGVAAKTTGELFGNALLMHYVHSAEEIARVGFAEYWKRSFRPYLRAAAEQFAPKNEAATERFWRRAGLSMRRSFRPVVRRIPHPALQSAGIHAIEDDGGAIRRIGNLMKHPPDDIDILAARGQSDAISEKDYRLASGQLAKVANDRVKRTDGAPDV